MYCTEVEAVLCAHPDVASAAAFGVPSAVMGELVAAAVVPRGQGGGVGQHPPGLGGILVGWCRARLAHYKVPVEVSL